MTDTALPALETPGRFQFGWIFPALFRPRRTFARIVEQEGGVWLTPMLLIVIFALLQALVAGMVQRPASANVTPPPGFESWTPEQQQQFFQAQQTSSGFGLLGTLLNAVGAVFGVLLRWVFTFGLLHLSLTLLGGQGSLRNALNIVAWAGLPFAVRDVVRLIAMLVTQAPIAYPGLSGFAPTDGGGLSLFLAELLKRIDLYFVWYILLIVLGVTASAKLSRFKALGAVLVTILLVLLLQSLPGFLMVQLSQLMSGGPRF